MCKRGHVHVCMSMHVFEIVGVGERDIVCMSMCVCVCVKESEHVSL